MNKKSFDEAQYFARYAVCGGTHRLPPPALWDSAMISLKEAYECQHTCAPMLARLRKR